MCFICRRVTLDNDLCPACKREVDRNNERVYLLSLLADAIKYPLPVYLRERIEKVLVGRLWPQKGRRRGIRKKCPSFSRG